MQEEVNDATGATLVGGVTVPVPGLTTTENSWAPPPAEAGRGGAAGGGPVATGAPESASRPLTLPPPVPSGVARPVLPAGAVQALGSIEDFALHELTSQDPVWATATDGVVWLVAEVVPAVLAEAVTDDVPPALR